MRVLTKYFITFKKDILKKSILFNFTQNFHSGKVSRDCCSLFLILSKNSTYCTYEPAKKYCLHDVRGMLASLKWCPYSRSVVDLAYSTSTCSINYFTFEKSKLNDKSYTYADTVSTYSH